MASSQILKLLAQQQVQNYLNQQAAQQFTPPEVSEDEIAKYQADYDAWKASQSKPKSTPTYESAEIPQLLPQFQGGYVSQNDARRSYKGNSALEREQNNKEFLQELEAQNQANNRQMRGAEINANRDALNMLMNMDVRSQGDLGVYNNAVKTQQAINNIQDQTARINELSDMLVEATKNAGMAWTLPGKMWNKTNPYLGLSDEDKAIIRNYIAANKGNQNMSEAEKATFRAFQTAAQRAGENLDIKSEELVNSMPAAQQKAFAVSEGFNDFFTPLAKAIGKAASPLIPGINAQSIDDAYATNQRYMNSIKERNPEYSNAGRSFGQMYGYAVTSPFVGGLAAKAGLGKGGEFALNQGVQLAQDLGLDIIPEAQRMLREEGKIDWGELLKRTAGDAAFNVLMNKAPDILQSLDKTEYENFIKALGDSAGNAKLLDNTGALKQGAENVADAFKVGRNTAEGANLTPNELFRQNINEGAEKLAKLNEQGYVPPQKYSPQEIASLNVNPVEANNKQFSELMDEFNHQFKDDSAMRNIFTPEDLEASQNSQFTELMKGRPKTIADLAPDEIPEITNELPDIPSLKNVDDYSNMWKADNEIPNIADNAKLPESMPENARRISDEIDGGLWTAGKTMTDYQNSGYFDNVTDPKVLKAWERVQNAYSDYAFKLYETSNADELDKAAKELTSAKKSLSRALEPIDPKAAKDFNVYKENMAIKQPAQKAQTPDWKAQFGEYDASLGDSFGEADKEIGKSIHAEDAVPETQKVFRGVDDDLVMAEDIGLNPKTDLDYTLKEIPESEAPKAGDSFKDTTEVKERGQSKHIRNADTPMKMEDVSDEVVADFEKDPDMYAVLKNADTKAKAEKIYNTSDNPEVQFRDMLRAKDPAALPLGHQLAKDYSAAGNHEAAAQIYREMGEELTKAGQFSQAAVINMMKNDPLTALQYAQRQVDQLNKAGADKFGKKWKDFSLTQDEINAFNKIEPGDADAIAKVFDDIGVRIGKEYPTTLLEKGLELRRIAMLFNSRTMIRNTAANIPTRYMRKFSDRLEAVGQNIVHLIDPEFKVTQSLTGGGKEGRKVATEVWNSPIVQNMLKDSPGKYELPSLKNSLINNKQMFKGTPVDRFLDKYSGDAFNKIAKILGKDVEIDGGIKALNSKLFGKKDVDSVIETVRNATYKALDMGDSPFVKGNFIDRLSSYIKAQGYKSADEVPEEAIQTAWEEAMKATYKDDSWAVHVTQGVKNAIGHVPGVGKPFADALIPFVQAPSNIAARMVDYSPIRGTKGVVDIFMGATKSNPKQITRGIEELSKGLTGTAATYLGYKLYEAGILTGAYSEDKDQKAFEKQNGFREFALRYGPNKYYTVNWMQPAFQSLMSGVIIADAINNSDQYDSMLLDALGYKGTTAGKALGVGKQIAKGTFNSWFDQSTMQSIQELFSGNYSNGTDIAGNIANIGVNDFVGSFVPSSINAVAKTADTTQRNTYDKSNIINNFVNQQKAKIPGLSQDLPAKYDTWGEEMKYADNNLEAAFNRFINPGEGTTDTSDDIDKEITRLFEEAKDSEGKLINDAGVFPQVAPYKVGEKQLNNEEVSQYQEDMGKRSRTLVESFMNSDAYKDMSDIDRIENIKNLYGLSKQLTEKSLFDKEIADSSEYKKPIEAYEEAGGGEKGAEAVLNYYAGKKIIADAGLSSSSNAAKEVAAAVAEGNMEEAQTLADNAAKTKEILDKYGVSNTSNAGKDVKAAVEAGNYSKAEKIAADAQKAKEEKAAKEETKAESSDELSSYGLTKPGPSATYQKAKGEIPGLTTQQFASTYKLIDSDGNQGIKQQELLDYLNKYVTSETKAQEIWSAYGGWKNKKGEYKKLIKNKDGSWGSSY